MNKEENVINFYILCNKLKNIIRTGWKEWHISKERLESVAEHVYGVQMLALAMYSEYKYDIDIKKVIMMLSVHELEEIVIGDLTLFDTTKEEKQKMGHQAVKEILKPLANKNQIQELILEFDEGKTKEAQFAFYCDKLEADLQAKIYDEENYVDLNNQDNNIAMKSKEVVELLDKGNSFGKMWSIFSQNRYNYDNNFQKVSEYTLNNKILSKKKSSN